MGSTSHTKGTKKGTKSGNGSKEFPGKFRVVGFSCREQFGGHSAKGKK